MSVACNLIPMGDRLNSDPTVDFLDKDAVGLNGLIVYWKELGGALSECGIAASSSFPTFNELRFIEPVGP